MSNNEKNKVVPLKREYEGYVSLDEYNRIKCERDYYMNECSKMMSYINNYNTSLTTHVYNQFQFDLNYFKQMYLEFNKDKNKENSELKEQLECVKEENIKLKDKEIQRLEEENKELKEDKKRLNEYIQELKSDKEKLINKLIGVDNK